MLEDAHSLEMAMTNLQKWFLIAAMWVVILALILAFYWVQIRPVRIRKMCAERAGQVSTGVKSGVSNMLEVHQAIYSDCCRRNGLKE